MTHWGRYWATKKYSPKKTTSQLHCIDSFQLYKNRQIYGLLIESFNMFAMPEEGHLKVCYGKDRQRSYKIPIQQVSCNYGGFRYYLQCPLCHKQMRFLYQAERSCLFLCRKCLNLSYKSQRLRTSLRLDYMAGKIKKTIKEKGGDLGFNEKPPRMHTTTYERLRTNVFDYEKKANQARLEEMIEWFGAEKMKWLTDGFI